MKTIIKIFNNLRYHFTLINVKKILSLNSLINLISVVIISSILYFFLYDYKSNDALQIFIYSVIFFALFSFIDDNYKLSNNNIIRYLQIFVLLNVIFIFFICIFSL